QGDLRCGGPGPQARRADGGLLVAGRVPAKIRRVLRLMAVERAHPASSVYSASISSEKLDFGGGASALLGIPQRPQPFSGGGKEAARNCRGRSMGFFRAILFAVLIVAIPLDARAQFMGAPGDVSYWLRRKDPACRQQSALGKEALKHSEAIQ